MFKIAALYKFAKVSNPDNLQTEIRANLKSPAFALCVPLASGQAREVQVGRCRARCHGHLWGDA